jgi:polar amino acid transport system substrate-binding protein
MLLERYYADHKIKGPKDMGISILFDRSSTGRLGKVAAAATAMAAFALLVVGCSTDTEAPSVNADKATSAVELPSSVPIPLVVPQQTGAAPYSFLDQDNELVGFAPELTSGIAAKLGYDVENRTTTFEESFIGMDAGKYAWVPTADVTAERLQKYDMALIGQDGVGIQVLTDSPDIGETMLDLCGLDIGVINGQSTITTLDTQSQACAAAGKDAVEVSTFGDTAQVALALKSGQIDAQVASLSIAGYQEKTDPGTFKTTGPTFDTVYQGIIVPKGGGLAAIISNAVNELIADGTYAGILANYGASALAITESVVNPDPVTGKATS